MKHPNAAVSGGTVTAGTALVWILGHFHVALTAEEGALIAGGASTVVLWIGRNGLRGVWNRIVNGSAAKRSTP